MIDAHHGWNFSYKPLFIGFILSLILVIGAYRIAVYHHLLSWTLVAMVVGLGVFQSFLQLIFFMHLGLESKPRWNLLVFLYTIFLIVALVGGTLWIMYNLDYNLMPMGDGY